MACATTLRLDRDAPVENSELLKEVEAYVQPLLKRAFEQQYQRDMQLAQARLQKAVRTRLARSCQNTKDNLPTTRSKRCLTNITGEPDSKVEPIVFVLLEALERSDYRLLLEHIAGSRRRDIAAIAEETE